MLLFSPLSVCYLAQQTQWHPWPLRDSGPGMRAAASSTAHHRPLKADSADGKFYILYYFISWGKEANKTI